MRIQQKPQIVWLHSHFLYWMGGTKFVYEVIKNLKKDFEILVIVENSTKEALNKYKDINVDVISLNKLTSTSPFFWITFPIQIVVDYVKIKNILSSQKYDVIVSSMFPMNVLAYFLRKKHVQYCFEPFAFFHDPEFIRYFPPLKRFFIKINKFAWSWVDVLATKKSLKIITLNRTTAQQIYKIYKRIPVISFAGIDTNHFRPFVGYNLQTKYKNNKIIIHSTDYTPVKGTDRMIKIFAKLKEMVPTAQLLITSTIKDNFAEENLRTMAKRLNIEDSVEFLGFVDYKILPQLYSLASVLVQCSYSKKSGTTSMALPVKEAMACGTLCIRYPIKNEDVVDGKTGFLVDPRNLDEMVRKSVQIITMPYEKYRSASINARKYIISRYNWYNTSSIIELEIKRILKQ